MCVSGVEAVDDPKGREDGTEDGKLANWRFKMLISTQSGGGMFKFRIYCCCWMFLAANAISYN